MPTSTRKNGITLIALIITIIVMLILVGVTINVALNGGLFDKAKTASDGTQKEADREALISAVIGTLNDNGTVNLTELQANLPDDFEYSNGIYTNTKNGKQYTVDSETGKVEQYTTNSGNGGGQTTYLDYTEDTLPKFTFNTNASELANLLDPTKNIGLTSIVTAQIRYGVWESKCSSKFSMTDGESYQITVEYLSNGESTESEDVVNNYYVHISYESTTVAGDYYYSAVSMILPVIGNITGGVWNYHEEDDEEVSIIDTCPIFENATISNSANASAYYQNLFVVVED